MDEAKLKHAEMFKMAESGLSGPKIAKHFGMHVGSVYSGIAKHTRRLEAKKRANSILLGVCTYEDFLNLDVSALDISARAYNCLRNYDIKTIANFIAKPDGDLLRTPNFGKKSLSEIKDAVNKLANEFNFSSPVTPIKNIPPSRRKPSDVLKFVIHSLNRMAEQEEITKEDLLNFARNLEEQI